MHHLANVEQRCITTLQVLEVGAPLSANPLENIVHGTLEVIVSAAMLESIKKDWEATRQEEIPELTTVFRTATILFIDGLYRLNIN